MNEARLNAASLHRAGEETKIRLDIYAAMTEEELEYDNLYRAVKERKIVHLYMQK